MKRHSIFFRVERGLSLIEVMVGITIGMFAIIVMLNLFRGAEGSRRISGSTADSQINLQIALAQIERIIKSAGVGLAKFNCSVIYAPGPVSVEKANSQKFLMPIYMFEKDGTTRIQIISATGSFAAIPTVLEPGAWQRNTTDSTITVDNIEVFKKALKTPSLLLLAQPKGCILAGVKNHDKETYNVADVIDHKKIILADENSSYPVTAGLFPSDTFSFTGGDLFIVGGFSIQTIVFNPATQTLTVETTVLGEQNASSQNILEDTLLRNVIAFEVKYGLDTPDAQGLKDGKIDTYLEPDKPLGNASVLAIRLSIVVQDTHLDKEALDAKRPVTTEVTWYDENENPKTLSITGRNQYYRHRVMETLIPIRNSIWVTSNAQENTP